MLGFGCFRVRGDGRQSLTSPLPVDFPLVLFKLVWSANWSAHEFVFQPVVRRHMKKLQQNAHKQDTIFNDSKITISDVSFLDFNYGYYFFKSKFCPIAQTFLVLSFWALTRQKFRSWWIAISAFQTWGAFHFNSHNFLVGNKGIW